MSETDDTILEAAMKIHAYCRPETPWLANPTEDQAKDQQGFIELAKTLKPLFWGWSEGDELHRAGE